MPSGSVLSKKWTAILSAPGCPGRRRRTPGPRAEPPIPIERTLVNFEADGGLIFPEWTLAAKSLIAASVLRDLRWIASVGASSGARSQ